VLRNPDLRLNAHYYITKVTYLEMDVVSLVFMDKYNKLNLCIAFILNEEGRLVGALYGTVWYLVKFNWIYIQHLPKVTKERPGSGTNEYLGT